MSVLTHDVILDEIKQGRLVIDPFQPEMVGPASIDLTLANQIRILPSTGEPLDITQEAEFLERSHVQSLDSPYVLEPGCTILGITVERVGLPRNLCGFLEGRSRFARMGLTIHVTSAFVQPGVQNRQVLELSNVSSNSLRIHAGVRLCQLVLMRTEGEAVYQGQFAQQDEV